MSRTYEHCPDKKCDNCGELGATDFMGDYTCIKCIILDKDGYITGVDESRTKEAPIDTTAKTIDEELKKQAAKACGGIPTSLRDGNFYTFPNGRRTKVKNWLIDKNIRNQIAEYLLPELEKRDVWMPFFYALADLMDTDAKPSIHDIQKLVFSFGKDLLKISPSLIVQAFVSVCPVKLIPIEGGKG